MKTILTISPQGDGADNKAALDIFMQKESVRKDRLLELFDAVEKAERKTNKKPGQFKKYESYYRGVARVISKRKNSVILHDENKRRLVVVLSQEILGLLLEGDDLCAVLGQRGGEWRVVFVFAIGSSYQPAKGGSDAGLH